MVNPCFYQVTLLRKLVIEQKTSCEMLYHNLLDCDPQTNSLRYKRVTCRKKLFRQDNGALSSNTRHGAPLERRNLDPSYSTDMAILWIEKRVAKCCTTIC